MKVIEALETGISIDAPSGKVTIDPPTHHCMLDVHIAEVKDKKFDLLEDFPQQKPSDTAAVCDLQESERQPAICDQVLIALRRQSIQDVLWIS